MLSCTLRLGTLANQVAGTASISNRGNVVVVEELHKLERLENGAQFDLRSSPGLKTLTKIDSTYCPIVSSVGSGSYPLACFNLPL